MKCETDEQEVRWPWKIGAVFVVSIVHDIPDLELNNSAGMI